MDRQGESHSFTGDAELEVDVSLPGRYLFVPNSTLFASRLAGALADQLRLRATSYGLSYYTADEYCQSPLLEAFEVHELLNLDMKRLKRLLRERKVGSLEIKARGVEIDPAELRRKLQPKGARMRRFWSFVAAKMSWWRLHNALSPRRGKRLAKPLPRCNTCCLSARPLAPRDPRMSRLQASRVQQTRRFARKPSACGTTQILARRLRRDPSTVRHSQP